MKSDYWIIDFEETVRAKVVFEEEVTKEEAIKIFLKEGYLDILDQNSLGVSFIIKAEAVT